MVFRTMKAEALSYAKQWNELEKKYTREGKLKKDMHLARKYGEYEGLDRTSRRLICDLLGVNKELVEQRMKEEGITLCKALQEMYDDGVEKGRELGRIELQQEKITKIQNMRKKGCAKEFILDIGYTEEEYAEATRHLTNHN